MLAKTAEITHDVEMQTRRMQWFDRAASAPHPPAGTFSPFYGEKEQAGTASSSSTAPRVLSDAQRSL
ncbi:hypothetical protein VP03_10485 [Sinorhizobium meliloti]|nr:hypothetical protein DU99_12380 [Sinorhizobium meliloti]KKA13941.1 hypothetical protein VP03_10485 [Sinorhizobium meliloti]